MINNKKSYKNPVRRMAALIMSILTLFAGSIFLYTTMLSSVEDAKQSALIQARDSKFELIWTQLQLSLEESYTSANTVAEHIEADIRAEFDLAELKDALDNNDQDAYTKLSSIIAKDIEQVTLNDINNHRNAVLVITSDGIILEDYTVDLSSKIPSGENFAKYQETAYNQELFSTALRRLKIHSTYIIATENIDYTNNDSHIKISDITRESLKCVFDAEGLAGLQNYQFMTPVYITDNGDIFGTRDIVSGVPQSNHKFIIIQTFNLYDQIMRMNDNYNDTDYEEAINERYDNMLVMLHIFGLALIVVISAGILYIMSLYNFITDRYEDHDNANITT